MAFFIIRAVHCFTGRNLDHGQTDSESGFTLLELLLALSLMAVLTTLAFSVFHTGSRAWEKGEALTSELQRLRIVPELLRRQIASLAVLPGFDQDGAVFRGESGKVAFFSSVSLKRSEFSGPVYVLYETVDEGEDGTKLILHEEAITQFDLNSFFESRRDSSLDLLVGYTKITFSFLNKMKDGEKEWLSSWNMMETEKLPQAVRITLQKNHTNPPLILYVPIAVRP